ncbi:MAG: glycosyltransferase family 2 protein [Halobacteriota archaeon]|jgi:dolichol-phosphate mannosyltransferase
MKAQVAVLIPTLNEEASIGRVIDRVPVHALSNDGYDTAIYVIDGNSEDETRQKALEKGAVVLPVTEPGKGAAMQHAFSSVRADYFIMIDGDATYPPERIADFVRLLRTYDVVIGSRLKGRIEDGAMTRTNRFGNRVLTALANALFKKEITDLCTGFWGYRSHVIDHMRLVARGFEIEADMFVECARLGFSIGELAIDYNKRADRPKLSSTTDGLKIGFFLLKRRMTLGGGREP